MKTIRVSVFIVLVAGIAGCDNEELFVLDPGATQNSGLDGDRSCENGTEDLEVVDDCEMNVGWPCECSKVEQCHSGAECIGPIDWDSGMCAPKCSMEETDVPFGMAVVEVCGTPLDEDKCIPVLSGCESREDCPNTMYCVEPSCITTETGCDEGAGETKVCFATNW